MTTRAEMKALRDAIAACEDRSGRVRPERVVEAARDPKSVLHKKFQWDIKKAAMAHWLETAQRLIREVKLEIVIENVRFSSPFYVADPSTKDSAYVETTAIAKKEELAEQVLLDEVARIEGAVERARGVAMVFGLRTHFEQMLEKVIEINRVVRHRKSASEARSEA